ncbi:hypothetical protein [Candidatus Parabeggiatoa sp. HSG14]|uniref:hypothetical protein n=1 Tax=Candidatus Parabeggiatoa sp. HSG14 TaxID=3055593 RepID=UPI0025A7606E|nr:hypothetical protein [Thiotrichales bacterium HSG14]
MTDILKIPDIITHIKEIINPDPTFILEIVDKTLVIAEEQSQANLKKVTIYGFDENTFAFRLDAKDKSDVRKTIRISEYLNPESKNINRGCDGIIFTCIKDKKGKDKGYAFVCEMKSGVPSKRDYFQQFRNSYVFIKFIAAILDEFNGINFMEHFQIKYILFDKKKGFGKKPTNTKEQIQPNKEFYDGKELCTYKIHYPNEKRSLNIKRLNLTNNCDK